MAIALGATITNADDTAASVLNATHTTNANTKALVVVIKGYDSSDADSAVTSLNFGGVGLTEAEYYRNTGDGDDAFVAVYYLSNPAIEEATIALTMGGSCTDLSWDAVNLVTDASADSIHLDSTDTGSTSTTNTHTSTVDPAATNSISICGIVNQDAAVGDVEVTTGTEITGSEVDFGQQTAKAAWILEQTAPTGEATIVWAKTTTDDSWACSATFYEEFYPTVALNTPGDTAEISDTTPDLLFTGTDLNSDELEYQLQLDTVNTFDGSTSNIDFYSETNQDGGADITATGFLPSGQTFTGNGSDITIAKFYLKKTLSPTGNCVATIKAIAGTYGLDAIPDGAALATSDTFDVSTLTGSYQLITFTFGTPFTTGDGTNYALSIEDSSLSVDASNFFTVGFDSSSPSHDGNAYDNIGGGTDAADFCFYVIGGGPLLDKLSVTPDATFAGTGDPHPWPSGNQITYTVQVGDVLAAPDTYYWRVRGIDPDGSNTYGAWSSIFSFDLTAVAASSIKQLAGVPQASLKQVTTVVEASIKAIAGVSNVS